jgi:tetratricopeptide (TPR) repeat protein
MQHLARPAVLALSLFLGAFCLARPSHAQDARAAARALAQEGAALFQKDDFQRALQKFQEAYDKFPSPKLFWNISQALRGLGRYAEGLEMLERFLAEANDASPEYRTQANEQLPQFNAKVGRVTIDCDQPGAVVTVDDRQKGIIPLAKPIILDPGEHRLSVGWQGKGNSVSFNLAAGQSLAQAIRFKGGGLSLTPDAEPKAEEPSTGRSTWYWVAGGVVAAAAATTLILIFSRSDSYPEATLGKLTIGDLR